MWKHMYKHSSIMSLFSPYRQTNPPSRGKETLTCRPLRLKILESSMVTGARGGSAFKSNKVQALCGSSVHMGELTSETRYHPDTQVSHQTVLTTSRQ